MSTAADYQRFKQMKQQAPTRLYCEPIYHLDSIAAILGSRHTWDNPADILEAIAYEVDQALTPGTPHVSDGDDTAALAFWRKVADAYSISHDGEEAR